MGFESFIANKILKGDHQKISRPIINITSAAITVGIALMILSIVVLEGFQREIRNKVVGFGSHITIVSSQNLYAKESSKILIDPNFIQKISENEHVRHVQSFAVKPGIIETTENIHGVLIKGLSEDFDSTFFKEKIMSGRLPNLNLNDNSKEILISEYVANRLEIEIDDRITVYFVQSQSDIKPRKFKVVGIYSSGLEEFDNKYIFLNLQHIRKISNWGLEAQLRVSSTCYNDSITVEALSYGGNGQYTYQWNNKSLRGSGPHKIHVDDISDLRVILNDSQNTIADTANVEIRLAGKGNPCDSVVTLLSTTGGSYADYTGGYEVLLKEYKDLEMMDVKLFKMDPVLYKTQKITDQYPEIFNWLDMLDLNVYIIIALMIFIALINMTSALLIIILEKTRMIGLLKSFGANNSRIIQIFLRTSIKIIGRGLIIGNLVGIGIAILQHQFGIISLDPSNYFVDQVPIFINWKNIIILNLGTLVICMVFLILPAYYVTRINPVQAIKLD